jgi:tungstate transport system substrate-binding protein
MHRRVEKWIWAFFFVLPFMVYSSSGKLGAQPLIKLATSTSTDNSGLLKYLHPAFERMTGVKVHTIAVGTGKALALGRNGDVDAVLVHARAAEDKFIADGHGVNRRGVMANDFIIVGPRADPAGIRGESDVAAALRRIAEKKSRWFSRGDDSGTHKKEAALWEAAALEPSGRWSASLGQGMGKTLLAADEKQGYTLTDRGTYIAMSAGKKISLEVLVEGDKRLSNPYGVIAVNPKQHPHVRFTMVKKYIAFLTSEQGQHLIAGFRMNGKVLFHPVNGDVPVTGHGNWQP